MTEPHETRLSEDLSALLSEGRPMTLGDIEARLRGRGFALIIMLLSVPFLIPNIPGLSTPFGAAIALMGLRIAVGRKPWLPQFVLRKELSWNRLEKIIGVLLKISLRMEKIVRPRMHFLQGPWMLNLIGVGIGIGGFFLLLPFPFPLSNTFPAFSILLLAAGMMERDGLVVLAGYLMGIFSCAYIAAWIFLTKAGFAWLHSFL